MSFTNHTKIIKGLLPCMAMILLSQLKVDAQVQFNSEIEQKIDSLFLEYEGEAGAAAAVYHNDKILYLKGFGLANVEHGIEVTPQSVFEVGSVAMHITATAILLLENEGRLSLDDPIQNYLPGLPTYKKGEVTIRHCFHHSSGLRDYLDLIKMTGRSQHINFDNKSALELLQKQKDLTIVPGSDYRYSHSNYLALALIVEHVSGMTMSEFAEKNIFSPLGMSNTFYYQDNERLIPNRATLYGTEGDEIKMKQNFNFTACGDGRLYTTAEDMAKWMANFKSSAIGGGPRFMDRLLTRGILNNGDEMSYALGLEYADVNGHSTLGHNGYFGGASAMFLHTPSENLSVIAMSNNADKYAVGKAVRMNRLLLKEKLAPVNEDIEQKPTSFKIPKKEKESFCGHYFSYSIGYDFKIYMKDNDLYLHDGEHDDALLSPIGEKEFRKIYGNNRTTIKFGKEGNEKCMYIRYGERPPMQLLEFEPTELTDEQLHAFTGKYHSDEIDVTYDLKIEDKKLKLYLDEKSIVEFDPLMEDLFNSDHDGFLKFEEGKNGAFNKFTINDYSLGSLRFSKR